MDMSQVTKDKSCSIHRDEPFKFYCTTHNIIVCCICAVKRHKLCNDVLTFPEATERFEREDKNLFKALESQSNAIRDTISVKNAELRYLDANVNVTKNVIDILCGQLHDIINTKRDEIFKSVDELAESENRILKEDIELLHNMLTSADKVQKHAEHAFERRSALSIIRTMVGVQNVYCDTERSAEQVKNKHVKCLSFQPAGSIQEILDNFPTLGTLALNECEGIVGDVEEDCFASIEPEPRAKCVRFAHDIEQDIVDGRFPMTDLEFNFMFDEAETSTEDDMDDSEEPITSGDDNDVTKRDHAPFVLKTEEEITFDAAHEGVNNQEAERVSCFQTVDHGKPCWLYGITFIALDRLAVTDVAHDSIQVFGVNGTFVCEKSVSFTPWDITTIDDCRVAVSAGGRGSIYLFEITQNELLSKQVINVGYDCICICYAEGVLTVGTRTGVVRVTDEGEVVAKIDKYTNDGESLRRTDFVSANSRNDQLFMTNTWRNKIVTINSEGQRLWEFEDQGHNPRGIVWHRDRLFVCSRNQGKVIILDNTGAIERVIASNELDCPYAIAHHSSSQMVAITQWDEKIDTYKSREVKIARYSNHV